MLVAVIFMLFVFMLALTVAAPKVARQIQRDREVETMQRGKQYIRAIRMYYKKFNAYPPSLDALVKTNNMRFLRKRYADPTTGKDEWKPIHFGQNKAPTAMGFFGKPLGVGGIGGLGPSGGNAVNGATSATSAFGSFGSTSSNSIGGTGNASTSGTGTGTTSGGATNTGTGTGTDSGSGSGTDPNGLSGQTFGGLGIIGFEPNSPKQSLIAYKTKTHYNEWEFVYDPIVEQMMVGGGMGANAGASGIQTGGLTNSPTGSTGTSGSTSIFGGGSSSFGSGGSTGSSGTQSSGSSNTSGTGATTNSNQ
jgi:type II secretory pathway pseudopilin PulG